MLHDRCLSEEDFVSSVVNFQSVLELTLSFTQYVIELHPEHSGEDAGDEDDDEDQGRSPEVPSEESGELLSLEGLCRASKVADEADHD